MRLLLIIVGFSWVALPGGFAAGQSAASVDATGLEKIAAGTDPDAAMTALLQLEKLGDPAVAKVEALAKGWLIRDRETIASAAALIDGPRVEANYRELTQTRAKALENLRGLQKGEKVNVAKQYHGKLKELLTRHNAACAIRWRIIDGLRRRQQCIAILDRLGKLPNEEPADAQMAAGAGKALGLPLEAALAIPGPGDMREPHTDAADYPLWFYRNARRIEEYNKLLGTAMNKWEHISVRLLNEYRESLGLFPMEVDPRLCVSARRHSKEMVDLDYFGHTSPTAGYRSSHDRMMKAGYIAGWRENIAKNVGDPERAFWLWFNSPPHHAAMTAPEESAMGCGRWDNAWTQHFGHGERLSLKTEADRAGELAALNAPGAAALKPQADDAKLPPVKITRVETDITVIDPANPSKRVTVPGPKKEGK